MGRLRISVLIPHFNNLSGLFKTIESLKTVYNYYLIIVDDGSEEKVKPHLHVVSELCHSNVEIKILYLEKNKGVEYALNHGLDYILKALNTEYIFRIDCGDICINNRMEKQVAYLDSNTDISLVGSWVEYVDDDTGGHLFYLKLPLKHNKIKRRMLVRVSFIHSAVMFRTKALSDVGLYSYKYKAAEDYAFFYEFIKKCQTANIPEFLTRVEWSTSGISVKRRKQQLSSRLRLTLENAEPSLTFIYGLIRLSMLIILPYSIIERVKKIAYR